MHQTDAPSGAQVDMREFAAEGLGVSKFDRITLGRCLQRQAVCGEGAEDVGFCLDRVVIVTK